MFRKRGYWIVSSLLVSIFLLCISVEPTLAHRAISLDGNLDGAAYKIRVPKNWNGTLLIYIHGYRDRADHEGEIDNRSVDTTQLPGLEPILLEKGYALAASSLRENGWAVEEGLQDIRRLTLLFWLKVGKPKRTILWGFSMGSVIALKSIELPLGMYDGAIAGCSVGGGTSRTWDLAGALLLAYDVTFNMPTTWGTVADIRDDIDFDTEVQPKLLAEVSNPLNFGRFEFIRLVTGIPGQGIAPPSSFYPGWLFTDMFFATEARSELERRAGGAFIQNLNHNYTLTEAEKAYLLNLGVDAESLLAAMNGSVKVTSSPITRSYVRRYADYSGRIRRPVLTVHTIIDPLVPVSHEAAYRERVANAGSDRFLLQLYTNGVGHCRFTEDQMVTVVEAMNRWLKTGNKPNENEFSESSGFVPGFMPPSLPHQ
jgi:pimeloyl-ACP methyl ester carboxylesterase